MKTEELLELIKTGEGLKLEFKEGFNLPAIGKEICAFANALGGKIILGVDDFGNAKGFNINNSQKSQIQQIARCMDPPLNIFLENIENLVVIDVIEGNKKPYSINGKYYLRVGTNSQQLKRDELREFFKEEGIISFDEKSNKKFDLEKDFDDYKFKKFLQLAKITNNQDKKLILKNLNLIDNGYLINAGALLFSHRITKFFMQAEVTCVLFEGTSSNIIDKKTFDADIISNYENAYNFILSKLNTKYIIEEKRIEKFELPKEAIRESLINALVHRDYYSNGHVQVNIFIDRLEIINPGGLVKGLDKRDFGKVSLPRNPLLFDLMARTKYVEKAGTGIRRIQDAMREYGLSVEFKSTEFFTVILEREKTNSAKNQPKTSQKPAKEERKKLIIGAIKENRFTKRNFAEELGINKSTVESDLDELKNEGKIEFVGPEKGGRGKWEVIRG